MPENVPDEAELQAEYDQIQKNIALSDEPDSLERINIMAYLKEKAE